MAVVALIIFRIGVVGEFFPKVVMARFAAPAAVSAVVVIARARVVIVFEIIVVVAPVRMFDLLSVWG